MSKLKLHRLKPDGIHESKIPSRQAGDFTATPLRLLESYAWAPPGTGGIIGLSTDGFGSTLGLSVRVGVGSSSSKGKPATNRLI